MLFHVHMEVAIPHDLDPDRRAELVAEEKARALELQRSGVWPHLWRIVGEYSNISVFDVDSGDTLHALLSSLPLFPYMRIKVTPLAIHPSDLKAQS
ncbi:muconolactone Delta-isomerase [Saccharopolyspora karakumensis]|uniref:Muconolactone Delta-isomerase n=1 Tax=Saccharopolyspora karakumensis TaxID=2530386 RepID=A0A4R5BKE7_9PSEU|nr:muconolactone Delta-isomerase [Saccharopolyspora karakumensis]TDD87278.1 muconolactone Delta-isomerase [Saccharopolyspora karakumensis]